MSKHDSQASRSGHGDWVAIDVAGARLVAAAVGAQHRNVQILSRKRLCVSNFVLRMYSKVFKERHYLKLIVPLLIV